MSCATLSAKFKLVLWLLAVVSLGAGECALAGSRFNLLGFETGFVAAFQSSGGNSQSGFVAYTPAWESSLGLGIKLRVAAAPFRAQSGSIFLSTDATAFLTYKPEGYPWQLEFGGGLEIWFASPRSYNPAFSGQISYLFERPLLLVWDRWLIGYRLTLLDGVPTHSGYLGVGLSFL